MLTESDIAYVPAGSMNSALSLKVGRGGVLWFHKEESHRYFFDTGESPALKGAELTDMVGTTNLREAVEGRSLIFITPRSWNLRITLRDAAPYIRKDAIIVCATKGFDEYQGKYYSPSQVIEQEVPDSKKRIVVMSGPNFASQIAEGVITGTIVAAHDRKTAQIIQDIFNHREEKDFTVNIYRGKPLDIEVVGAFKNVVGLVMGFVRTLDKYGENTGAFVLEEGLREAALLCRAMKCNTKAVMELCGIGDYGLLMNSKKSRNVEAGFNFGMGTWDLDYLKNPDHTIEGVRTVKAAKELAGKRISLMPLTAYAYRILYEGMDPKIAARDLLSGKFPKI